MEKRVSHINEKLNEISERLVRAESQIGRLVSDAESEKDTRKRSNTYINGRLDQIDTRFRTIERTIWFSAGAVGVIIGLLNIFLAWK